MYGKDTCLNILYTNINPSNTKIKYLSIYFEFPFKVSTIKLPDIRYLYVIAYYLHHNIYPKDLKELMEVKNNTNISSLIQITNAFPNCIIIEYIYDPTTKYGSNETIHNPEGKFIILVGKSPYDKSDVKYDLLIPELNCNIFTDMFSRLTLNPNEDIGKLYFNHFIGMVDMDVVDSLKREIQILNEKLYNCIPDEYRCDICFNFNDQHNINAGCGHTMPCSHCIPDITNCPQCNQLI